VPASPAEQRQKSGCRLSGARRHRVLHSLIVNKHTLLLDLTNPRCVTALVRLLHQSPLSSLLWSPLSSPVWSPRLLPSLVCLSHLLLRNTPCREGRERGHRAPDTRTPLTTHTTWRHLVVYTVRATAWRQMALKRLRTGVNKEARETGVNKELPLPWGQGKLHSVKKEASVKNQQTAPLKNHS
jgi:hypothetical protein